MPDSDIKTLEKKRADNLQVIDAKAEIVPPTPERIDLFNATEIRREMGKVYRDMRNGRIATQDGTRLVYVLDMVRKAYETDILSNKIKTIEQTLKIRG